MSSSTQICNIALSEIGEDPILSLDENSRAARACNLVYDDIRKKVLRSHDWNFATDRVELALLTGSPSFGFDYQYQLPSDYLRLTATSWDEYADVKYKIEGNKLLINESSISIVYVKDFKDSANFDELFQEALSFRIASKLAIKLADDKTLRDRMMEEYMSVLAEARSIDSQEGTPDGIITSTWTNSRL